MKHVAFKEPAQIAATAQVSQRDQRQTKIQHQFILGTGQPPGSVRYDIQAPMLLAGDRRSRLFNTHVVCCKYLIEHLPGLTTDLMAVRA